MLQEQLTMLESQLNGIASNWNGDESGIAEERFQDAEDGIRLINELREILNNLNIL